MSWPVMSLSEVCAPVAKMDPVETGRSQVRYVDIGGVDGARHLLEVVNSVESVGAPSRCRQVLRPGDTVFSTVRPYLEKIAFIGESLDGEFASTGFCVLRPKAALDPKFLFHFATSRGLLDQVVPMQKGVSYPAVLEREVRSCRIPVPPVEEQRRIVAVLEEHLTDLSAAITSVGASRVALDMLRSKTLAFALEQARHDTEIRDATIGELALVGTGTTPSRSQARYYEAGSIPWITSGDLSAGLIVEAQQFVTELALRETSLRIYPSGTLLVAMYGEGKTRGSVAELGIAATVNQACAAIQLKDSRMLDWVRLVLAANYSAMRAMASGGVQPNLNLSLVRGIGVPVPSVQTRERLVRRQSLVEGATKRLAEELARVTIRAESLRRSLLAAAFAGRLTGGSSDTDVIEELAEGEVDQP